MRASLVLSVSVVAFLLGGCGPAKLNVTKSFNVPDGDKLADIYILPAVKAEQNVSVNVTADKPVDVYVLLSKDLPDAENKLPQDWIKVAIASKKDATSETLSCKIPANQEWKVFVTAGQKTAKANGKVVIKN